jgi:hypothetical protein
MILARTALEFFRRAMLTAALVVLTPVAVAQDRPPGGPHGGLPPLAAILLADDVHASLALNATQESVWAALDTLEANVHSQMQAAHEAMKTLVAAELAKTLPDLALIESTQASARQTAGVAMQELSTQAGTFYASLTDAQKAVVVAVVQVAYQRALAAPRRR